ncbi:MAG: O-antigen ligase family protein [bacterium]
MRKSDVKVINTGSNLNLFVKWVIAAFFAILPIFYFGKDIMNAGNVPTRILFLFFFIIIIFICGLKIADIRRLRLPGKMTAPLVVLLLVIFASAVFSPLKMQVFHTQIWSENMLLSQWMAGIFMLFCLYQLLDTDELIHTAIISVAIGGGIAAILGLMDFFIFQSFATMSAVRLTGTFFNPMFAGNYLLICIPFSIGAAMITKKPLFYIITGLLTLSVILTNARAAWVALFIYAIYLVVYFAMKNRRLAISAIIGIVVAAALIFAIPQTRGRITALIQGDNATRARVVYMRTAWNEFLARPILGWGVDSAQQISPQFRPLSDSSESNGNSRRVMLDEDHSDSLPHNIILLVLAELGIAGIAALIWLKLSIIGVVRKNGGMQDAVIFTAVGALTTWGIANLFSYDNTSITCLVWLSITLIALRNKNFYLKVVPVMLPRLLYTTAAIIAIVTLVAIDSNNKLNRAVIEIDQVNAVIGGNSTRGSLMAGDTISLLQSIPMPDNVVYRHIVGLMDTCYEYAADDGSKEIARVALQSALDEGLRVYYRDWLLLRNGVILNFQFSTPDKAFIYINALKKFEPNSAGVRVLEAETMMMTSNLPGAEKSVQEAIHIAPNSPMPYMEAGKLYLGLFRSGDIRRQKLLNLSEIAFRRGAEIDMNAFKTSYSYIIDFCTVLLVKRKYDDVVKYGRVLKGNERDMLALRGEIARILSLTGDNDAAKDIFKKLEE